MHHQDAMADKWQQYTKPFKYQHESTFITGYNRYVLFFNISFHNDPSCSFTFGFVVRGEEEVIA